MGGPDKELLDCLRRARTTQRSRRGIAAIEAGIRRELRWARRRGFHLLHRGHELYPSRLLQIADAPHVLAVAGDPAALSEPAVAMVGSRHPSAYGRSVARALAGPVAASEVVVVSGLARGVDALCHEAALEAGGRTVAVLGSGLERVYPPEHAQLARRIASTGAVVSELPPDAPPLAHHFPRRNRIIAGLCPATVVVEATERSGSLITAKLALDYGRSVLAVPGRVGDAGAAGPLDLLREGAAPACDPTDILLQLDEPERSEALALLRSTTGENQELAGLDGTERQVLSLIPARDALALDALLELAELPADRVLAALFSLELRSLIEHRPGNRFTRT